jgi:hypothetical protein
MRMRYLTLILLAAAPAALAGPVRKANLVDLCGDARVIVSGRIMAVQDATEPGSGLPTRAVTLRVRELIKSGNQRPDARLWQNRLYTFKQYNHPGLQRSDARLPEYRTGEEVILFLAGTSRLGLTAPIGLTQGKFTIKTVRKGTQTSSLIANAQDNANLTVGQSSQTPAARARALTGRVTLSGLNRWEREVLTRDASGPLEYDPFVQLVKKLALPARR